MVYFIYTIPNPSLVLYIVYIRIVMVYHLCTTYTYKIYALKNIYANLGVITMYIMYIYYLYTLTLDLCYI